MMKERRLQSQLTPKHIHPHKKPRRRPKGVKNQISAMSVDSTRTAIVNLEQILPRTPQVLQEICQARTIKTQSIRL